MNEACGRLRRQARIVEPADYRSEAGAGAPDMMRLPPPTPEAETGGAEICASLERAIEALPGPLRLTYVLRDRQELTTRALADLLDLNPIPVKTRLFRARRRLRDTIRQNIAGDLSGIFPCDGARRIGMANGVLAVPKPGSGQ